MDLFANYGAGSIAAAIIAALGSAFIRGLAGFGMAILLVPILALALSPLDAVLTTNVLAVLIGLSEIKRLLRGAERSAWTIIALIGVTTPIGLYLLTATSPSAARIIIALIAVSAFLALLLPRKVGATHGFATTVGVGALSGLMTGYAGMPGPPVVPYYVGRDIAREMAVTSMLLIFTFAAAAGLVSGAVIGVLQLEQAMLAALLFPAVLLGNFLGAKASGRIADPTWRACVGLVLGAAALAAIVRAF